MFSILYLFVIYLICLALIFYRKQRSVFALLIVNFVLSILLFLYHSMDVLNA